MHCWDNPCSSRQARRCLRRLGCVTRIVCARSQGEQPKKKFERGQFERRARMDKDPLESLLFRLFERQVFPHALLT